MDSSLIELVHLLRSRVTEEDIREFVPNDPGSADYFILWDNIRRTGMLPGETCFDLTEVIHSVSWNISTGERHPDQAIRFRQLVHAVALALVHVEREPDDLLPRNDLACRMILDVDAGDTVQLRLLSRAFAATRELLMPLWRESSFPFFTFGGMILAQLDGDYAAADTAATQLLLDEAAVRADPEQVWIQDDRFLLGLPVSSFMNAEWVRLASLLSNPLGHPDTARVIEALREVWV